MWAASGSESPQITSPALLADLLASPPLSGSRSGSRRASPRFAGVPLIAPTDDLLAAAAAAADAADAAGIGSSGGSSRPASHSLKRPRGASPLLELCCPDGGAPTGDMDPPPVSAITGLLAGLVGGDGAPSLGGASCSSAVERLRKEGEVLRLSELPFYDLAGLLTPLIASSLGAPAASVRSFLHLNEIPEFKPATSKLPSKPATPKVPSPPTPQTTPQPLGSAHSKEQRSGEQLSGEQNSEEQRSGESRRRSPRGLVAPGGPIGGSTPTDPLKGVALPPPEA